MNRYFTKNPPKDVNTLTIKENENDKHRKYSKADSICVVEHVETKIEDLRNIKIEKNYVLNLNLKLLIFFIFIIVGFCLAIILPFMLK